MIIKLVINSLMIIEVISLTILTATFGSLFLFFEQSLRWHVSPALNFGLPIAVALICQLIIGLIILNDVKKRVWSDEIKCDIWASLGRSDYIPYNCSLYAFPLLSFAYFIINMKNDPNTNWWRERQQTSALFRLITHKAVMGFLSRFTVGAPFVFIAGMLLFAIGGALDSVRLSLLGFQVLGGMIILLPPVFAIFQFVVLTHFLSRKWVDHSYELFYGRYPVGHWPKHDWLDARRYYQNIMSSESNNN
jgi:hypothetical protein